MNIPDLTTLKGKAIGALAGLAIILAAGIGGYLWGDHRGYAEAKAVGDAALQTLKTQQATAVAESLAQALKHADELTAEGNKISTELINTRADLAAARKKLNGRIPDVAATVPADCAFGPDFVRLCNDLAGLGSADLPQAAGAGGAAGPAASSGAAGAGVRQGAPVAASPADLLAWLRDYGAQCQDYKALAAKRLELLDAWSK